MSQPTLNQYDAVKYSRIYALGAARGDLVVTNDDVAGPIDSSDEWIRQRTGIVTRKRADKEQSLIDMAAEAANEAIAKAGIQPGDLVMQVAGQSVSDVPEMLSSVAALKPGEVASLSVLRNGKNLELRVTPGTRPVRP